MKISARLLVAAAALVTAAACTLQTQDAPALTGPSEMALSITLHASPDVLQQDGGSQSLITITARDHNGQPVAGLGLIVQTAVGGTIVDYGTLSAKSLVTNANGQATVVYTAPPPAPATATGDTLITIIVTPVGTNYDNTAVRFAGIRLTPTGVILPPNGAPTASFNFNPSSPRVGDEVLFDASASTDDGRIVRYDWNWGDGDSDTTTQKTIQKDYERSGSFTVTLTVTDDQGRTGSTQRSITVGAAQMPTANFTFSPTDPAPGDEVHFNASASTAPEGAAIVSYAWDFGDGSTGTGRTPSHTYALGVERTYTVTLTVTDSEGRTHTTSKPVTVKVPEL